VSTGGLATNGGWMCYRQGVNGPDYVEALPGDGGKDWGYTEDHQNAILLTRYWKARFLSDMRHVSARGVNAIWVHPTLF